MSFAQTPAKPAPADVKAGKNEFKCFHCREIRAKRDGDWVDWGNMQVHLCRTCDRDTAGKAPRVVK